MNISTGQGIPDRSVQFIKFHAEVKNGVYIFNLVDMIDIMTVTAGTWVSEKVASFDQYVSVSNTPAQNSEIRFPNLNIPSGTYDVKINGWKASDQGIVTVSLDATQIGTADLYSVAGSWTANTVASALAITGDTLKELRLKMATKNASSSNYGLRASSIIFTRTGD